MNDLWMKIGEMAIGGSIVLLAVILIRFALKKAPKKYMCFLWTIAFLRLCIPYLPTGPIPAFWEVQEKSEVAQGQASEVEVNSTQHKIVYSEQQPVELAAGSQRYEEADQSYEGTTQSYEGTTQSYEGTTQGYEGTTQGYEGTIHSVRDIGESSAIAQTSKTENFWSVLLGGMGLIWILGAIVALARFGLQYFRISKELQESVPAERFQDHQVKEHPLPGLPAVLGVLHPCIYVPDNFDTWEEKQKELILLHEATHIRRGDHLLKLFSIFVLCVYWWNPIVWIGVKLLHCDIEMACDEGVLAGRKEDSREAYAKVLLFHAVHNKQIALPIAFGENHTEGRIKNILRYRKNSILVTAELILVVGILVICIGTKPREASAEETESELSTEEVSAITLTEEVSSITSTEESNTSTATDSVGEEEESDFWTQSTNYWTERLTSEGKVKNPATDLFTFTYFVKQSLDEEGKYHKIGVQAMVVDETGNVSLYQTTADLSQGVDYSVDSEFYMLPKNLEGIVHEELGVIDRKDEMMKLLEMTFSYYTQTDLENDIYQRLIFHIADRMKEKAPENYKLLFEPETSAEILLHLKGRADEFIYSQYNSGFLKYTLADGEQIIIEMVMDDDIWYPREVLNTFWEQDENQKKKDLNMIEEVKKEEEYLENVTADTLRKVKSVAGDAPIPDEWQTHFENKYFIISKPQNEEAKNEDVALYAMHGGNSMVLRAGEKVVPIRIHWTSPQMNLPMLFCGDFDGDGETEYVIKTHFRTGTGISGDEFHVVEVHGDSYKMYTLADRTRDDQIDRIVYSYDEEQRVVTFEESSGKKFPVSIGKLLDDYAYPDGPIKFDRMSFGAFEKFYLQDNCWYYSVTGFVWNDTYHILFDDVVEMTCPLFYSESEGFSFGEIHYTEAVEE